ncbi:hypothetical protein Emag_004216 [Eimeria magna]
MEEQRIGANGVRAPGGPSKGPQPGPHVPEGTLKKLSMKNKRGNQLSKGKRQGAPLRGVLHVEEICDAAEAGGPSESSGRGRDESLHLTPKKHNTGGSSSSSSNSSSKTSSSGSRLNSGKRKLPQWVVAALKAGQEAKGHAAAAAAARSSRPPLPNLTLALVGEVAAEQQQQQQKRKQQQQQQQEERKGKKVLSGLSGVEYLDLCNRGVRTAEDLSALKQLARIDLSNNCLTSLSFLSLNLSLHHIKASKNLIPSLGPSLKELTNLRVLDLSDNKLQTMEGFDGLPNLKALILSGNEISQP